LFLGEVGRHTGETERWERSERCAAEMPSDWNVDRFNFFLMKIYLLRAFYFLGLWEKKSILFNL